MKARWAVDDDHARVKRGNLLAQLHDFRQQPLEGKGGIAAAAAPLERRLSHLPSIAAPASRSPRHHSIALALIWKFHDGQVSLTRRFPQHTFHQAALLDVTDLPGHKPAQLLRRKPKASREVLWMELELLTPRKPVKRSRHEISAKLGQLQI